MKISVPGEHVRVCSNHACARCVVDEPRQEKAVNWHELPKRRRMAVGVTKKACFFMAAVSEELFDCILAH